MRIEQKLSSILLLQHKTPARRQLQRDQCASHVDEHPPTVTAVDSNISLMVNEILFYNGCKNFGVVSMHSFYCLHYQNYSVLVKLPVYWGSKMSMY